MPIPRIVQSLSSLYGLPVIVPGHRTWSGSWDEEGNREYKVKYLICAGSLMGPAVVSQTPGLPVIGSPWVIDLDLDLYAWCRPNRTFRPLVENEPNYWWEAEFTFSTKAQRPEVQRCHEASIEIPTLEPPKVSGSFSKFTREVVYDLFGQAVKNSAHEQMRGPQMEFDHNRPTVRIEQNVYPLGIETFAPAIDAVNSTPMWGLPPRTVKLSNVSWDRQLYGLCFVYYKRTLEFEVDYNTWDHYLLDEGTKVLRGDWDYDFLSATYGEYVAAAGVSVNNPQDFVRYKDWYGENARVVLNGAGMPVSDTGVPGYIPVWYYRPFDFFASGLVPATLATLGA